MTFQLRRHDNPFITRFDTPPADAPLSQGPLQGLRLAVKDLFAVAGHRTSAGNPDWLAQQQPAASTAPAVKSLLAAGAELVGMTCTDELAYSLMGNNIHYGALINPAAPDRVSGGSSNGSAVAVAAGLADIGLGTDTGGSIRVPASFCGLYGLRPSHGVVDISNVVGLAPPFDTVGWMTRDLLTLQAVGEVLLPPDQAEAQADYELWWPDDLPRAQADVLLARFQAAGLAVSLRLLPLELRRQAADAFRILQGRAAEQLHGDWVRRTQPGLAADIAGRFAMAAGLTAEEEAGARAWLEQHQAELLTDRWVILPTTGGAAPRIDADARALEQARNALLGLTALGGLTGRPQASLPLMQDQDAPWGLSLLGPRFTDRALLRQAEELLKCF